MSIATKPYRAVCDPTTATGVASRPVEAAQQGVPSLSLAEIGEIVRLARRIERHAGCPQDGEFAVGGAGAREQVFLLQARPETVWSRRAAGRVGGSSDVMGRILGTLSRPDATR